MKIRMEVTRFTNEDVLATSAVGPIGPSGVCTQTGMTHILATRVSYDPSANITTVTGPSFVYIEKGKLQATGQTIAAVEVEGKVDVRTFVYFDGSNYYICEPQAHAR